MMYLLILRESVRRSDSTYALYLLILRKGVRRSDFVIFRLGHSQVLREQTQFEDVHFFSHLISAEIHPTIRVLHISSSFL